MVEPLGFFTGLYLAAERQWTRNGSKHRWDGPVIKKWPEKPQRGNLYGNIWWTIDELWWHMLWNCGRCGFSENIKENMSCKKAFSKLDSFWGAQMLLRRCSGSSIQVTHTTRCFGWQHQPCSASTSQSQLFVTESLPELGSKSANQQTQAVLGIPHDFSAQDTCIILYHNYTESWSMTYSMTDLGFNDTGLSKQSFGNRPACSIRRESRWKRQSSSTLLLLHKSSSDLPALQKAKWPALQVFNNSLRKCAAQTFSKLEHSQAPSQGSARLLLLRTELASHHSSL